MGVHSCSCWNIQSTGLHGPFSARGSLLLLDHTWGTRIFFKSASLRACLPKPTLSVWAHSQEQCLVSGLEICSALSISSCPAFSSENSRIASFHGKRQESFTISDSHCSLHAWIYYLYHGILFSSGNHRFLLFLHLSQDSAKDVSIRSVPD